ncbi:MAG: T9SS type A sorting domain-containing protein [Flavobacteriia bacterium]|nr:T9SS type A sorting domain-containing protein [Flavobacteriia bacterium]
MKVLIPVFFIVFATTTYAQTFQSPESVEWDDANQRWLIANTNDGKILQQTVGQSPTNFASGCTQGPYGIEILNNVVYANDGGLIRGFSLATGTEVFNLDLGGTFLNGLTTDGDSVLYATDFSAGKIYRINPVTNAFYLLTSNLPAAPNGIIYDAANERCLFVNWGSNAKIKAMSILSPYTVTNVMSTTLGNCDGISRDQYGAYYVTAWSNNRLNRVNADFSGTPTALSTVLSSPADIDIKLAAIDTVGVPNTASNTVVYIPLASSAEVDETQLAQPTLHFFYNAAHEVGIVDVVLSTQDQVTITVHDLNGKVLFNETKSPEFSGKNYFELPLGELPNGTYMLTVQQRNWSTSKKWTY